MSDPLAMEKSQGYLTAVTIRALIFIEASDLRVGLICLIAVGMGEVSSYDATIRTGGHVEAGNEIGTIHYEGLSHYFVFGNKVDVHFVQQVKSAKRDSSYTVPVKSLLARCFPQEKFHM